MEYIDVIIHNSEAERPNIIPAVSTRKAKEIPGDISRRAISGYLPLSTSGNIENIMANIVIEAAIVQNSRIFGPRDESKIRITARTGTSTAIRGLIEKNVSIKCPYSFLNYEIDLTIGCKTLVTITALITPNTRMLTAIIIMGANISLGGSTAVFTISSLPGGEV
jgi:hypothetical protein